MKVTLALLEENVSEQSWKLRVHWTRKGCKLWVSDPSKTSSLWTLVHVEDFFREEKLWASTLMVVARSVGGTSLKAVCKPINPGGGDGSSLTMCGLA